jgi:hypothetical protein
MKNVVAGEDSVPVEWDMRITSGLGSSGDHDLAGFHRSRGAAVDMVEANHVWRGKGGLRGEQLDIVSHQLVAGDIKLVMNYPVGPRQQILDRDVLLYCVGRAIKFSGAIAGQLEDRLAQGFRGDRAEIDAAPAEHSFSLDDRDPLAELGSLDGGPLSSRAGADHQEIVIERVLGHASPFHLCPIGRRRMSRTCNAQVTVW